MTREWESVDSILTEWFGDDADADISMPFNYKKNMAGKKKSKSWNWKMRIGFGLELFVIWNLKVKTWNKQISNPGLD